MTGKDVHVPHDASRDSAEADAHPDVRSIHYPAPHGAPPTVEDLGGPVASAPNLVPIFFGGDGMQSQIESFLASMAASSYWPAATSEYGVGSLTIAPSIVVTDPPPSMITDPEVAAWLAGYLDGAHPAWPPIAPDNIYMVFYPSSTTIEIPPGQVSCTDFGGYHYEGHEPIGMPKPDGGSGDGSAPADAGSAEGGADGGTVPFTYAVVPRCAMFGGLSAVDAVTSTASHEAVEAATDPLVASAPAYGVVDSQHSVWDVSPGGELADMCAFEPQSFQKLVGSSVVQRIWSNAAAAAGNDPCVPSSSSAGPYYNSVPDFPDDVVLQNGVNLLTKGLDIPVGQKKNMTVRLFSTGPTPDWEVYFVDTSAAFGGPQLLEFTPNKFSGNNGDVVTVEVKSLAPGPVGGAEFLVYSYTSMSHVNFWFGFVQN